MSTKQKLIRCDEYADNYLLFVMGKIRESGIKKVSRADALKVLIKMSEGQKMPGLRRRRGKELEIQ